MVFGEDCYVVDPQVEKAEPAAPSPAIASHVQAGRHWRGVGELERCCKNTMRKAGYLALAILTAVVLLAALQDIWQLFLLVLKHCQLLLLL